MKTFNQPIHKKIKMQQKRKLLGYWEFRGAQERGWGTGSGETRDDVAVEAGSKNPGDGLALATIWTGLFCWADSNCPSFSLSVSLLKTLVGLVPARLFGWKRVWSLKIVPPGNIQMRRGSCIKGSRVAVGRANRPVATQSKCTLSSAVRRFFGNIISE